MPWPPLVVMRAAPVLVGTAQSPDVADGEHGCERRSEQEDRGSSGSEEGMTADHGVSRCAMAAAWAAWASRSPTRAA